jgi:predicted RNase H-like nuclease (RuvC/YqgF family)
MDIYFQDIVTYIISPLLTLMVGWLVGRRKAKADANSTEINNVSEVLVIYRGIIKDFESKVKELEGHIRELEARIDTLENENKTLKKGKS